jgi:hypothetical protein
MDSLSLVFEKQGNYQEAEELISGALEAQKRKFKKDHLETLLCMSNLSTVLVSKGSFEDAEAVLIEYVSRRQRLF